MPTITVDDGCPIHVEVSGRDNAPALMLSNSLGTDLHMWDDQADEFARHFRLIRYDRRGHGQSGAPPGPYSFDRFGRDILGVLDGLGVKQTNWCGLSMGGMDGQWLGANAPDRINRLVLANTHYHYADKAPWADRLRFLEQHPLSDMVVANMERWFTTGFRERAPKAIERMSKMFIATDRGGYSACVAAVRDIDFRATNPTITLPTLVIVGAQDPATPPAAGETIAKAIPGAKLVALDAAHISNVEQPQAFTKAVLDFLLGLTETIMDERERYERGMAQRRKVLGNAWVDRANTKKNAFTEEFQDFITRAAWGEVWTRPHFDERTRRVLVIGTMLALDKWEEFRMHVRAALTEGGFTPDDIKEIILQQAIYCGVPAANHAFKEAAAVIEEVGKAK